MSKRARLLLLAERLTVFVAVVTVLAFAYLWHATLEQPGVAPSAAPSATASAAPSATPSAAETEAKAGEPLAPEPVDELGERCEEE